MRITEFKVNRQYKYLWLKYVTGFNLNVHCARCLLGDYSKHIGVEQTASGLRLPIELDEHPFKYIYICGVTTPYVWKDNVHLALEECKGETVVFDFNDDIHIVVEDARRIPIYRQTAYSHEKGRFSAYNTCRNWQFAYQQSKTL